MTDKRALDWPTAPNGNGEVPPHLVIMAQNPDVAPHAALVLTGVKDWLESEGHSVDIIAGFQVPLETPDGWISLPCLAHLPNEPPIVFFSHAGPWADHDGDRLLAWATKLRAHTEFSDVTIELLYDTEPPASARQIAAG